MELETLTFAAAGNILNHLLKSHGAKTAGKELSSELWQWVRPLLLEDEPDTVARVEKATDAGNPEAITEELKRALADALHNKAAMDPAFAKQLLQQVEGIQDTGEVAIYNFGNVDNQVNNPNIAGDSHK